MDEWLAEFSHWVSEEEDFETFAQQLCHQFLYWTTEEEEYLQYSDQFLQFRFHLVPVDIHRKIQSYVWKHQRKQFLPFGIGGAPDLMKRLLQARYHHCFHGSCRNCGWKKHCH